MKLKQATFLYLLALLAIGCSDDDSDTGEIEIPPTATINFQSVSTIKVGGEASAEISAFDPATNKLFTVNVETVEISVFDLTNLDNIQKLTSIPMAGIGVPNSVSVSNGLLAVALENDNKQLDGSILLYNTATQQLEDSFTVGALPDMVTFSPNGEYIVCANEGEPNDEYTVDPNGSISIIEVDNGSLTTLDFSAFASSQSTLVAAGFRIFGPGGTFSSDIEPEYVAISDDSKTAWVTLQENNGIAKVNLDSKTITDIFPLGFKDHSQPENSIDASDRDGVTELKTWPVQGIFMPDAIEYANIGGTGYLITANEGDARDYDGFSEEERVNDLSLDPTAFPDAATLQLDENLGRLQITTTLGDPDDDGDYDELYCYGARSFTVWSENGQMLFDSGNEIESRTLTINPAFFNADEGEADERSDAKGPEPEAVEILKFGENTLLFVGLERSGGALVYDISNPTSPAYLDWLLEAGDFNPEGLLAIPSEDSPSGKDLLIVTNEVSGTITIFENQ